MVDWSNLPDDIIHKVSTFLITIEDFLAFSAVCVSWRLVYLSKQWKEARQPPFLMFSDTENGSTRSFLSLSSNRAYKSELPEASGRQCFGSSTGWLLTHGSDHKIQLLNPFTRASIDLPPKYPLQVHSGQARVWYEFIEKSFVFNESEENEPGQMLVMIIYGTLGQLAFCWPGNESWITVRDDPRGGFLDVAFVKGQIIALLSTGSLVLVDINRRELIDIEYMQPPELAIVSFGLAIVSFPHWDWDRLFLVEASGDLWMVFQNRKEFAVYGYDFDENEWIRLRDLGDHAVFVGDNGCVCVRGPGRFNCRRNSVYFVGKDSMGRWPYREFLAGVGVYSVADGSHRPVFCGQESRRFYSFALWVVPTLH